MAFRVLEEIPGAELSPRPEDAVDPRPRSLAKFTLEGEVPSVLTAPTAGLPQGPLGARGGQSFKLLGPAEPQAPAQARLPGPLMSSPGGFFGPGVLANLESRLTGKTPEQAYEQRVPQLEKTAGVLAPLVAPGAGSVLGRLATQGAVGAGMGALTGAKGGVEGAVSGAASGAATGAAGAGVGEGLSQAGRFALSAIPFRALQERTGAGLSDWLTRNIPSWKGLGTGPKALWEMAHGSGQARLDESFRAAKAMIPPTLVTDVSEDVAKRLGAKGTSVAVRELVDALPKLRGPLHRDAWAAIDTALDKVPQPLLQAARSQYRLGMGWIEFANKGKFLSDTAKGFDLLKAQKALSQYGRKSLLGRGMEAPFRAIQGQGAITPQKIGIPTGVKVGPMPVNIPLGTAYRGVPQGPLGQAVQSLLGRLGAAAPAAARPQTEEEE